MRRTGSGRRNEHIIPPIRVVVIPTPGHTPGHVCLLFRGVLLAGELAAARNRQIQPSPAIMTWNMPLVTQFIKKVAPMSFEWVCPGHGMPVKRGDQWEKWTH